MKTEDKYIAIRKSLGNTWELISYKGHVMLSGIRVNSYYDAYDYVRAYASSFLGVRAVVLNEDGTEWEYPKKNF